MLKFTNKALRYVLKMTFHSRSENLLASRNISIIVIIGIACLLRDLFMCSARGSRDGYPLRLADEAFSHFLNELVSYNASARM